MQQPATVASIRRDTVHPQFTAFDGLARGCLGTLEAVTTELLSGLESDPVRLVALEAVHNFRDLGGYATADGRCTRWRTLFRADGLYRLTAADVVALEPLGLRTVIDLRSSPELDERGTFPVDAHPVVFLHLPIIDATWATGDPVEYDRDEDFLIWAYQEMLTVGAPRFAAAFAALAQPDALPAVFHCAAGKDRTGLLAALLLGSLGVSHDDIVADYTLTVEGMQRFRVWAAREWPEWFDRMATMPPAFTAALPEAMRHVIEELCAKHGSIRAYVRSIGVSDATLATLESVLLA
ncbi:MAG: protein-tyrosine phosphatase [Ilumatobacteraceae bacterium]